MNRDVELFSNHTFWVGEEREWKVTDVALEARQFFGGSGANAHDGATDRGKQVVLFLERQTTALAGG